MEIFNVKNSNDYDIAVDKAFEALKDGGIVVHPTDTCYGLAADIINRQAVEKVYAFKKRNSDEPVNIIVFNQAQFRIYGQWRSTIGEILLQNKKRMCSFVVSKTRYVPAHLNPKYKNIGIQIPKHVFSLKLLEKMKFPLVATSANLSGHPSVYSIPELLKQIENSNTKPDLIIDSGQLPFRKVSMVIEILKNNQYKILRK